VINKRQVKHSIYQLQRIKTWQLVVVFVLFGFFTVTLLRLNNIGMVQRREAVKSADEVGDSKVTQNRLYDLQRYVSGHMNTDMGSGVTLEKTYLRDYKKAEDTAAAKSDSGNIYKKAQEVCAPRFRNWSMAYVQCTASELAKYPSGSDLNSFQKPDPKLYHYSFVSPSWSPDFAGFSVLISVVIFIMIFSRLTSVIILKTILSIRGKHI